MDEISKNEMEEVIDSNNGKKKSIKKNYIYNVTYQIFLLIVPIAVTPYVAKILLADGIGIYSYTYSIVTYFVLFAALSFGAYAQRLIARYRSDKKSQSKVFWEIVIAQFSSTLLALIVYIIMASFNAFGDYYNSYMWIMSLMIVSQMFDITFLFSGNEEFGKIVLRNVIIKGIGIICIFVFVNQYSDLWKYILIQCLIIVVSNLSLWLYLPKMLVKINFKELKPLKHVLPSLMLLLPTIATTVYTNLDKTMIGLITSDSAENGDYETAIKIVKLSMTVITSLGTVYIPRNSMLIAKGETKKVMENIFVSCKFVMFLGIPMVLGLICVADNLVPWYLGDSFSETAYLIKVLSPIIIIIGLSNVFGIQYLIPACKENIFTIAVSSGAVLDFIMNLFLIKYYGAYGAAISTVAAEAIGCFIMIMYLRKKFSFLNLILKSWKYIIAGICMFVPCFTLSFYLGATIPHTIELVLLGIGVYFVVLIILRDDFIKFGFLEIKKIFNTVKAKIK